MKLLRHVILALSSIAIVLAAAEDEEPTTSWATAPSASAAKPPPPPSSNTGSQSIRGFHIPGLLARDVIVGALESELRSKLESMYASASNNTVPVRRDRLLRSSGSGDLSGLNDVLADFTFETPIDPLEATVLGVVATIIINGECGNIFVGALGLDYNKGGSTLTYKVDVQDVDVKCKFFIDWDLGVLDIDDSLKIMVKIENSDVALGATLLGSPPDSSRIDGCEILLNVASISASGGFSANILNELEDLVLDIAKAEMQFISDGLCQLVTDFTPAIDELLATLSTTLEPYLTSLGYVDPLKLENELDVDEDLVSLRDGELADILDVFIENLDGVFGADQVNTLIELNLLNEDGILFLDLQAIEYEKPEDEEEDNKKQEDKNNDEDSPPGGEPAQEVCGVISLRRRLQSFNRRLVGELQKQLETELGSQIEKQLIQQHFPGRNLQDPPPIFDVNEFVLNRVEIIGLNTFKDTDLLRVIGEQTLQTKFSISGLKLRITLTLDANLSESNFRNVIQATLGIDDISVVASYLVGLSQDIVDQFTLGTFLDTDNIVPCLLSSVVTAGVSELAVNVKEISTPIVTGALSPGVDNFINTAVEAAISTYQDLLLTAVPNIFQNNVTVIANDFIACYLRTEGANAVCPNIETTSTTSSGGSAQNVADPQDGGLEDGFSMEFTSEVSQTSQFSSSTTMKQTYTYGSSTGTGTDMSSSTEKAQNLVVTNLDSSEKAGFFVNPSYFKNAAVSMRSDGFVQGFIDFRDLLLSPEEAKSLGGSGTQPYGDLIAMAFGMLKENIVAVDNTTGLAGINGMLLDPLTASQSNVSGMFRFPDQLFNFTLDAVTVEILQTLMDRFYLSIFNARIQNVNTIVSPVSVLQPTTNAHVLENIFNFGPVAGRPLNLTVSVLMDLQGSKTPFELTNEIDISATIPELDVFTDIRIMVATADFLGFPIKDILNFNCWLALIQVPNMDFSGGDAITNALAIRSFLMKIMKMSVGLQCLSCTSSTLPEAIGVLEASGAMELLGGRVGSFAEEIMTSDLVPTLLTDFIKLGEEAARLCPHSPHFNTTADLAPRALEIPPLSAKSVDTLIFTGILGAQVFTVVVAESHLENAKDNSDFLSGQASLSVAEGVTLVDFTNFEDSFIPFAGELLNLARNYLGNSDGAEGPGVNALLGGMMDEDSTLRLDLGLNFAVADVAISVESIQVKGLDSFTHFDVLQPIAPQTFLNSFVLKSLSLQVQLSVNVTSSSEPPQPYTVGFDIENVNTTVALFTSIDMDKLGALELGSLLFIENIPPCLLSTIYDVHVPALHVTVGNMSEPIFEGLLPDTSLVVAESMRVLFNRFGDDILAAVNSIFDGTLRPLVNDFISSFIQDVSVCQNPESISVGDSGVSVFKNIQGGDFLYGSIDFRDLLLSPEKSRSLGGSGEQPYGDLIPMVFGLVQEQLAVEDISSGGLLGINAMLIDPLTESQSGQKGVLHLKEELFAFALDKLPIDFLAWLDQRITVSAANARVANVNTLMSPISILQPTHRAHVLENMINLGPLLGRALNATVALSMDLKGFLSSLNMHNEFDISAAVDEVDLFADFSVLVARDKLFRFPLRDILAMDCWFSLIQPPAVSDGGVAPDALEVKSFLMKLVSMSVGLKCLNCTSDVLPELIDILDQVGVTETMGNRAGPLIEDLATSDLVPLVLNQVLTLGEDAARLCPHSPLFNTSTNPIKQDMALSLPALSSLSLDTLIFAVVVATEIATVVVAENHLLTEEQSKDQPDFNVDIPEGANLLDWSNLKDSYIPFIADVMDLARNSFNELTDAGDGTMDLGINVILGGFLGESGVFELPVADLGFEISGLMLKVHSLRVEGVDSFSEFNVLQPLTPKILQNSFHLKKLKAGFNLSIDMLGTPEPPQYVNMTFSMEDINMTMPILAAIDEDILGALEIGALLHIKNILPCLMSTAYGFRVPQMLVNVGKLSAPSIDGFFPDTGESVAKSMTAVFYKFGDVIRAAIPKIFDNTVRVFINGMIDSFTVGECQRHSANATSHYVDFREVFLSDPSPYGDLLPLLKGLLQAELLSNNPDTQMPKINDVLIAPFTEGQSGVQGTLLVPGQLFGFDFAFAELGLDKIAIAASDARVENLNSIGPPLQILDPNITSGILLDNRATIGTEFNPLRFAIKGTFALSGSLLDTHDEMDIFGELRGAPFFLVLLARLGAHELVTFPLRYIAELHCWLATIAAPALEEIASGKTKIDPVLAIDYLGIAFSSIRVSASCFNCTTPGLIRLPELLEVLETSGTKDVLGYRSVDFLLDMLDSDFVQVWLLRIFQDSMKQCPRTANSTEATLEFPNPDFPKIPPRDIETGVFALSVLVQLGSVILAETITTVDDFVGPLFQDPQPNILPGTKLIDFTALDTYPVGGLVNMALDGANSFLGGATVDPETGEASLGINGLLADNPLMTLDSFSQELNLTFGIDGFKVGVKSVNLEGIDTFTKFHVANITGPTLLQNELGWKNLRVALEMFIDVGDSPDLRRALQVEDDGPMPFTLEIEVTDVEASLEVLLALDYELLKNLELGSFLRIAGILPCIQGSVLHLEITKFLFTVGEIKKLRISGFPSSDTSMASENLEKLILEHFGGMLADAAPSLFSVAVRPLLNSFITSYLRDSNFKCDEFPFDPSTAGFVDFRDLLFAPPKAKRFGGTGADQYGDLIRTIYTIVQLQLYTADENGIAILNPIVGSLSFPGTLLDQGIKYDVRKFIADVSIKVSDLKINNLDSLGRPLSLAAPIQDEAHQLNNSATFGIGQRPVTVGARIYMHIKGLGPTDIVNDFDLQMSVHAATVVLTMLLKVSENSFVNFPLRDMLNYNCWLAMIPAPPLDKNGLRLEGVDPTAAVTHLGVNLAQLNLNVTCHTCTSPAMHELVALSAEPESVKDMTELANNVLKAVMQQLGGPFLQDQIDRILVEAPRNCAHADEYDANAVPIAYEPFYVDLSSPTSSFTTMLILIFAPLAVVIAISIGIKRYVTRRHKKWLVALPSERVFMIQQKQEKEDQKEAELNEITESMFKSKDIPVLVRYLIPVIVVINIGFFLSGHLDLGARVLIKFTFAGEPFEIGDFFTFSIGQTTVDMWHSGGRELALLILLFSGVWPYTKQLITLALWFLPPSVVSCTRRGQFLLWLDALAKWSMADIFVMLITVTGFRVEIDSPTLSFLPKDFYSIDLIVVPLWGLYANMIAQIISQISSHFIVHYHRKIMRNGTKLLEDKHHPQKESNLITDSSDGGELLHLPLKPSAQKEQLYKHPFVRPHNEDGDKLIVRRYINFLLFFGSILLCILLAVSCDLPSLKLESLGLVGLIIELGQNLEQAVRYEGVFSTCKVLIDQARFLDTIKDYIGLGFLAFLFVFTCLIIPILQIMILVFQWFVPLAEKGRERAAVILEILQAWQYVDVYIVAIIIESWQLGQISELMLNRFCTSLEFTFSQLVYYGAIKEEDAQCFKLEASITAGAYLLVPIMACLALLNTFVVKAVVQQLREKTDATDIIPEDEKLRAFDRTTWDNRSEAMEQIRVTPVLFTDTFRWTLRKDGTGVNRPQEPLEPAQKVESAETFASVATCSSDEEHGVLKHSTSGDESPAPRSTPEPQIGAGEQHQGSGTSNEVCSHQGQVAVGDPDTSDFSSVASDISSELPGGDEILS